MVRRGDLGLRVGGLRAPGFIVAAGTQAGDRQEGGKHADVGLEALLSILFALPVLDIRVPDLARWVLR